MKWLVPGAAAAAALAIAGFAYVNLSDGDPAAWHADPLTAQGTGRPNEHRVTPDGAEAAFAAPPEAVMAAFDAAAMAEPRTKRLAGAPEDGHVTYLQRTPTLGWPDYVSVKVVPVADGSALAIWSRSRYGYSDLGVNRARVERWTDATRAALN